MERNAKIIIVFVFLINYCYGQRYSSENIDNRLFEIGAIIGEPTGLVFKFWVNPRSAVDLAAAWMFENKGHIEIHADYLYHPFYIGVPKGILPLYLGLGPSLKVGNGDPFFGLRVPFGLEYFLPNAPLSLFGEVGPRVEIIPSTSVEAAGGVGIRFVF